MSSDLGLNLSDLPPGILTDVETLTELKSVTEFGHLAQVLNALPAAVYTTDTNGRITYFNEAAAALWGYRPKLYADLWCGSWRLYHLDGTPMPHDTCPMAVALKERRPNRGHQAIAERPDGSRVPFMAFPTPLYDAAGAFIGAVNMLIDMRAQQRAEHASHRLAAIVESSEDAIISKDLNGVIATWNRGAERLFGYLAPEVVGKPITILIPDEHRDEETRILERVRRGERIEHYETMRRRKDGTMVSISLTVSPITDEDGRIVGASKIARDITEQKRKEEQITLLAREADHRTKNLLALAQAAVHLTNGESAAELRTAIEGRLRALANAHALLAQSRWAGADLRSLALDELSPYCQEQESRARIDGPSLMLEQEPAQAMALALHELTTNAVKYGALSVSAGRVDIAWRLQPGRRLAMRWSESGGPAVKPPAHKGFGTRVMTRICDQLNGELTFDWRADGLVCDIGIEI
ncbi:MAG TPA: PAS domain S-box protein [Xanthobacteraceae bacterium]|jgi:PAS domain S-box-containing protein|nr:PAS domain S-box protein [Xanthobacteraceae bacterium]